MISVLSNLQVYSLTPSSMSFGVSFLSLFPLISVCFLVLNDNNINGVSSALAPDLKPAAIGGCYDVADNILVYCAAVAEECEGINATNRVLFKPAKEIESLLPASSWCSTDTLPVGTCKSTGQCALTKHACDDQNQLEYRAHYHNLYEGTTTLCDAHGRFIDGRYVPTQYGACLDRSNGEVTCVISPEDCLVQEQWISANEATKHRKNGCRCHDVRIGVCQRDDAHVTDSSLSTCAISRDDCLIMQKFQPARVVMEQMTMLDCRLCPYDSLLVVTPYQEINTMKGGNSRKYEGHGGTIFIYMVGIVISFTACFVVLKHYDSKSYVKDLNFVENPPAVEITNSSSTATVPPSQNSSLPNNDVSSKEEFPKISIDNEAPVMAEVPIDNEEPVMSEVSIDDELPAIT